MIFNPLFIDSDSKQLNLLGANKDTANSHLFKDIIKLEGEQLHKRHFNSGNILPTLLSEVKKMKNLAEYDNRIYQLNNKLLANNLLGIQTTEVQNDSVTAQTIDEKDIHKLLQKIFAELELDHQLKQPLNETGKRKDKDLLSNINIDKLVTEIEAKLSEQKDVNCLITTIDENTNILLSIHKNEEGSELSEDDLLTVGKNSGNKYTIKVFELGVDETGRNGNIANVVNTEEKSLVTQTVTGNTEDNKKVNVDELMNDTQHAKSDNKNKTISDAAVNKTITGDLKTGSGTETNKESGIENSIKTKTTDAKPVLNTDQKSADNNAVDNSINEKKNIAGSAKKDLLGIENNAKINLSDAGKKDQEIKHQEVNKNNSLSEKTAKDIPNTSKKPIEVKNTEQKIAENAAKNIDNKNVKVPEKVDVDFVVKLSPKDSPKDLLAFLGSRSMVKTQLGEEDVKNNIDMKKISNDVEAKINEETKIDEKAAENLTSKINTGNTKDTGILNNKPNSGLKENIKAAHEQIHTVEELHKQTKELNTGEVSVKKTVEIPGQIKDVDKKEINTTDSKNSSVNSKEVENKNTDSKSHTGDSNQESTSDKNKPQPDIQVKQQQNLKFDEQVQNYSQSNINNQQPVETKVVKVNLQNMSDPNLANKLSDEISEMVISKGKDKAVLSLEPKHLGKIKIAVEIIDNQLTAKVEVENKAVRDMLQNQADVLKENLNNSGLQLSSLNISLQQNAESKNNKNTVKNKRKDEEVNEVKTESKEEEKRSNKSMGYNTYEFIA